jgi:hypothetical protein
MTSFVKEADIEGKLHHFSEEREFLRFGLETFGKFSPRLPFLGDWRLGTNAQKAYEMRQFRQVRAYSLWLSEWLAGAEGFEPRYGNWNRTLSPVRDEPQNLISLKSIGPSKRWIFENRTESTESRASEINGLFGE